MNTRLLIAAAVIPLIAVLFVAPIPQDPAYHQFADTRTLLRIDNFWNVLSNILFLFAGLAGLSEMLKKDRLQILPDLTPSYVVFFAGVLLTAFGSSWYHLNPNNESLVWDRLPMTLAFMGFFSLVIGEQVSRSAGRRALLPLLFLGAASVVYWASTESRGSGDLRMYAVVQFLPMLLVPLMLVLYQSPFDRSGFYWLMIGLYVMSKITEHFDQQIFSLSQQMSGHSIKHVLAALAAIVFLGGLKRRRPAVEDSPAGLRSR